MSDFTNAVDMVFNARLYWSWLHPDRATLVYIQELIPGGINKTRIALFEELTPGNYTQVATCTPLSSDCPPYRVWLAGWSLGTATPCSDALDNDGDGFIDYPADSRCLSPFSISEGAPMTVPTSVQVSTIDIAAIVVAILVFLSASWAVRKMVALLHRS